MKWSQIFFSFLTFLVFQTALAEFKEQTIMYENGQFEGYMISPQNVKPNTPAILMIHNWMGVSEETKTQARRFAKLGYIVFAADVYGKGVRPKDTDEAAKLATQYKTDRKSFRKHLNRGLLSLMSQPNVDKSRIAAIGYCFGGTGVIELSRTGAPILGAISFHGGLDSPTPDDGKNIKAQILALHGDIDPYVKNEDLQAFENEMKKFNVKYELVRYPGAVHSFTEKAAGNDIKKGAAYNAKADEQSFEKSKVFLSKIFSSSVRAK